MKKKILLSLAACFIAAGSFINLHMRQNNNNTDFSLADFAAMAQADGESGAGQLCYYYPGSECRYEYPDEIVTVVDGKFWD